MEHPRSGAPVHPARAQSREGQLAALVRGPNLGPRRRASETSAAPKAVLPKREKVKNFTGYAAGVQKVMKAFEAVRNGREA